jgi:quinol-cytochrome oxidoreductase complex cytochrome b subunit
MLAAILIFFTIPIGDKIEIKSPRFHLWYQGFFAVFVTIFITLGYLGGQAAEEPFIQASRIATFFYFYFFSIFWLKTQDNDKEY